MFKCSTEFVMGCIYSFSLRSDICDNGLLDLLFLNILVMKNKSNITLLNHHIG